MAAPHPGTGTAGRRLPLTQTFDSAIALRDAVKIRLGRSVHIIAVILFPDMQPDRDIEAWARARGVRVLWGCRNLVERLLRLAEEEGVHDPPPPRTSERRLPPSPRAWWRPTYRNRRHPGPPFSPGANPPGSV